MRLLKVLLGLVVVAVAVGAYLVLWPCGPQQETFVDIAPGTGSVGIAQQLQAAGVIRSAFAFEAWKAWNSRSGISQKAATLKAGEYRFTQPAPMTEVYQRLVAGDVFTIAVSVPEGYNIFDVASAVAAAGLGSREKFLAAETQHPELVAQWSPGAKSVEGFLFPDTYRFSRHATPVQMISAMVRRFGQEAHSLGLQPADARRVVTEASLVEREVHIDSERSLVAGVFQNRLAAGMPLQTDPSVAYASMLRGTWTGVIHASELSSDSPYNTYKVKGLPPGPVCNPGMASLRAAMHPATTNFLYFVADANGATRFAETLNQHNDNVAAYRRRQF